MAGVVTIRQVLPLFWRRINPFCLVIKLVPTSQKNSRGTFSSPMRLRLRCEMNPLGGY